MVQHSHEKFVSVTFWMIGFQVCAEPIEDTFLCIGNELVCIIWARVKFMESFWCACEDTRNRVLRRWALMGHDGMKQGRDLTFPRDHRNAYCNWFRPFSFCWVILSSSPSSNNLTGTHSPNSPGECFWKPARILQLSPLHSHNWPSQRNSMCV